MGNQHSKAPASKYSQNYIEVQKQEHPFLGTITHLNHRSANSKHFLKVFKFATSPELAQALKRANKRKQLCQKKGSPNIVRTTEIDSDKQNELCGITHYLYIVYEDYNASLGQIIKMKASSKQNFTEEEVLQYLRGVCNGLIFLQDNGYKNYAITKESVVKGLKDQSNNSMYKIFDTQLAKEMPPYPKLLNHIPIEKGIYLAPEILQQLVNKNPDPDFALKSDIFSMGMVAVQMCTLEPLDHFYDYDRLKLNSQGLYETVGNLKNYSPYLKSLLLQILEGNQEERIGVVSLRQKLNINDNKSTTDYAFSAIGNSNVTQRTHKVSYPFNNVRDPSLVRPPQFIENGQNTFVLEGDQRIPRVLTVDQLRNQTFQPVPVPIPAHTIDYTNRKNQTFDQIPLQNKVDANELENRQKNKSTQKYKFQVFDVEEQRKRTSTVHNFPFYYPAHTKPMTVPIAPSNHPPAHQFVHHFHNAPIQLAPKMNYNHQVTFITNEPRKNASQGQDPVIQTVPRVPEIQIPDALGQKNEPQTPINNLADSNTFFVSEPLSLRPKSSGMSDDLQVLNSMNVGFKKVQSRDQYESPNRIMKNQVYPASNQSTPIRKVQALQSHGRNSFNQIIRETQEEENEVDMNPIGLHKIIQKNTVRGEAQFNGPKTYGKHHFTNGAVYEGEFDNLGNFCGNGVLYYSNGKICYSGGWVDNSFHGFGVLNNETVTSSHEPTNYENFNLNDPQAWHHYEGEFCMDKKNGFGTLYMCNGDKFSGCFVKDLIQGYGTFTSSRGDRVSGIWNQNVLKKL